MAVVTLEAGQEWLTHLFHSALWKYVDFACLPLL